MKEYIANREKVEWLNYWIEDADKVQNRILLIGDSVTRQYRPIMNHILLSKKYVTDLIALSHNLLDPMLYEELSHFMDKVEGEYDYSMIIFHLGAHHGYCIHCRNNEDEKIAYSDKLNQILKMLALKTTRLITVVGTPENEAYGNEEDARDHNKEIQVRNRILEEISKSNGYEFIDLYQGMKEKCYKYQDGKHFLKNGYEYIVNRIIEVLFGEVRREVYNELNTMKELNDFIKSKNIYIFGNGECGKLLEHYFALIDKKICGYIVSDEYYIPCKNLYVLKDIEIGKDDIVIVTAKDYNVYCYMDDTGIRYVSLSNRIYLFIEEFVNAYG